MGKPRRRFGKELEAEAMRLVEPCGRVQRDIRRAADSPHVFPVAGTASARASPRPALTEAGRGDIPASGPAKAGRTLPSSSTSSPGPLSSSGRADRPPRPPMRPWRCGSTSAAAACRPSSPASRRRADPCPTPQPRCSVEVSKTAERPSASRSVSRTKCAICPGGTTLQRRRQKPALIDTPHAENLGHEPSESPSEKAASRLLGCAPNR